jgi:hypothetical protein
MGKAALWGGDIVPAGIILMEAFMTKSKLLLTGILAVVLVFELILTACPNDTEDNNPTVTGVTVSPKTVNVTKGGIQPFIAVVNGTNNPVQTVIWSIVESGKASGTTISDAGLLTVASDETLTALTVRATSTFDTTKYD